jgi:hypothetical protein
MRFHSIALLAGIGMAAAAVIGLRLNSSASAAPVPEGPAPVERFVLQASGDVPSCSVEKAEGQGPLTHVLVATDCDVVLPGLSKLHYWSEKPDGTVELSADGGRTAAVVFAPSDGVAYESVEPRTPLMSLIDSE